MKNWHSFITILISNLFFISCDPAWEQRQIDKAKAHETRIIVDTIFLDFRFGMTQGEYRNRCDELLKGGRIKSMGSILTYEFKTEYDKYETAFEPEYNNGRLYRLIVEVKPHITGDHTVHSMINLLMTKYSAPAEEDQMAQYQDCDAYRLDKGNLRIKVFCNADGNVIMTYTDKRVDDKLQEQRDIIGQQRDSIEKEDVKKSLEDL